MTKNLIELRLRRVGNSLGVILPTEALEALGVEGKEGEKLMLTRLPGGDGLELKHVDAKFEKKLALLRDTMKRFRNTLRELAK
ncbi:MAG: AbrB/MazE/SpoVT family DNA-binding domain-containing protein [Planctomycetes bacterium]|nr:AbrB/MazE/SpoVT family DNA-binding domain-containing protein [Planctomycetota bacterium]